MQAEGTLQIIAEVSVAFAGFTSVVAIFGNRGDGKWTQREALLLRFLVEYSVAALLTALLPLVLWNGGFAEPTVWRLASGASALQIATYYATQYGRISEPAQTLPTWTRLLMFYGDVSFGLLLVYVALLASTPSATVFLVHLYWLVLGMAAMFVTAVAPLWQRRD